jgi:nitrate/nitrite transporter NarK
MQVGGALGPLITGNLLASLANDSTSGDLASWRICLFIYGIPGLLWTLLFWAVISTHELPPAADKSKKPAPIAWGRVLTSLPLVLLCLQQFLRAAGMVFFLTWFPVFLQETRGVSVKDSGVLTFWVGLMGFVGSLTGGFVSDGLLRLSRSRALSRQGIAVLGLSACAALIVGSYYVSDTLWAIRLISLGVFCATFGGVSSYTMAIDFGGKQVATVFSTMNMCGNVGATLFPIAIGWLVNSTSNWNLALFTFAGVMTLAAACWALLNPRGTLFGDDDESGPYTPGSR